MADAPPPTAKQAEGIGCLQDGLAKDTYLGGCTLVDSSNPTVSTGVDRCQTGIFKTLAFWRPSANRKTTRFEQRDAKLVDHRYRL